MIEGLDKVLEGRDQPGLTEVRALLQRLLDGHEAEGRLIEEQTLQPRASRVFRLRFVINGQTRQLIVKRLRPEIGRSSADRQASETGNRSAQRIGRETLAARGGHE